MATDTERTSVEALARDVVADVSPAELPLFRATADRYYADPDSTLTVRGHSDEALGFGAETAIALVGPFALDLVRRVVRRLVERVGDAVAESVADRVLRARPATAGAAPAQALAMAGEPDRLDAGQLALVRQVADEEARRLALPPERAQQLADALVASIATRV